VPNGRFDGFPGGAEMPKQQGKRPDAFEGPAFRHQQAKAFASGAARRFVQQLDRTRRGQARVRITKQARINPSPLQKGGRIQPHKAGDFIIARKDDSSNLVQCGHEAPYQNRSSDFDIYWNPGSTNPR
jgi:hypothetical protein